MSSSDRYKNQIMNDLAGGNVESLDDSPVNTDNYDNFDDFAQRSSREERRGLFGRAFHHDNVSPQQMEPELQTAIAQIQPNERDDVARDFLKHLKQQGLNERDVERQLNLSTHHPNKMNADDVSKLASFVYHSYPNIFQEVMADQPALLKFLSNPLIGAALGVVAAKWLRKK
jgi:cobalamin biosynthesis Mg chelatase CobN